MTEEYITKYAKSRKGLEELIELRLKILNQV